MNKKSLTIGYLYPDLMNIYGDTGNIVTLQKRCEWRGIEVKIKNISVGDKLKTGEVDLFFFGGGQDESQNIVAKDLCNKAKILKGEIERGVPLLAICGGYQLLGEYYLPFEGERLEGVGVFPVFTKASSERMIGNIVIESDFGELVGFENHSGKTFLHPETRSLGKVVKGFGNNGEDSTEGCIYKNAIGCYLHGSLLPKNPKLADFLIQKALEVKYKEEVSLKSLDDSLEESAHKKAVLKFS